MVLVRDVTDADLPAILALYDQLADGRAESFPAELDAARGILEQIRAAPGHTLLVAVDDSHIVGTAAVLIAPNLTHGGKPWAIVENVTVDERARRSGIGTALMTEIERRVREAGGYKIQLLSRRDRADAHRFYAALGYESAAEGFRRYFDQSADRTTSGSRS